MKKVLAWAVALALVLSSFTMAFAADAPNSSQFKDADQIQYTEAVDVMVALGVINGFPDGTFGPQKTVTRGQMAKMIAVIMNGGEDVGDQYKSACPFADSKDHWAAGYIAYCASEHIIDGRSADVFDPDADVTGTEVAKMALTSLGYDSQIQGYTGETWAANVLKDAKKAKLFAGLDKSFVPGDPCSREAAAQILFNMLKAPTVEYDTNISMSTADGTNIAVASKVQPVVAEDEVGEDGKPLPDETGYVELYEDVFGEDSDATLESIPSKEDEYGRPGHAWKVEGDDVGTYSNAADYEFTAAKDGLDDAIAAFDEDLADQFEEDGQDFDVVVNGVPGGEYTDIKTGDKVELFVEDGIAVVIQYEAARITAVDTEVSDEDAEAGITAYLTLEGAITEADSDMAGYDASTYVEGAVIAVAVGENEDGEVVLDSCVLEEAASGNVTAISKSEPKTFTIDGKKYETAGNYAYFDDEVEPSEDVVYTLYDYNGFVLASVVEEEAAADAAEFYGVLIAWGEKANAEYWSDADSNYTSMFKIFTAEGKAEIFTINKDMEETGNPTQFDLVKYTLNEDDEIVAIAKADEEEFTKPIKSGGTLNGYEVSEDVVGFYAPVTYKTEEREGPEGQTYEVEVPSYDVDEWVVYDYAALEEADGVPVEASFKDGDNAYVALKLSASLEATPEPETVFGFISSVESEDTTAGEIATIGLWKDGKDEPFTTAEGYFETENAMTVAELKEIAADQLVMMTLEDGAVTEIAVVEEFDAVGAPAEEFTNDAAMYSTTAEGVDCDADVVNGYTIVKAATSTTLTFGKDQIDKQNVSKATVYLLKEGKLSVSKASAIKPANDAAVKIYQVDAESGVWNIVVYQNDVTAEEEPAGEYTVTWAKDSFYENYLNVQYGETTITSGTEPMTVVAGTITFTAESTWGDMEPKVTVGEQEIQAENGVYSVNITGDTTITITLVPIQEP